MRATKKYLEKTSYHKFYEKFIGRSKISNSKKEDIERKIIINDLEKILKGKQMVIDGNLSRL